MSTDPSEMGTKLSQNRPDVHTRPNAGGFCGIFAIKTYYNPLFSQNGLLNLVQES